jgi:hypothetical protein
VPHLLQYVSNGNDYGRIKLNGKLIRECMRVWRAGLFVFSLAGLVLHPHIWLA